MTYFGLISADWWLIVLAYIGTLGPAALALWLFMPDAMGHAHTQITRWSWIERLKARNQRIVREREARR
jgi:hypothetical protein